MKCGTCRKCNRKIKYNNGGSIVRLHIYVDPIHMYSFELYSPWNHTVRWDFKKNDPEKEQTEEEEIIKTNRLMA